MNFLWYRVPSLWQTIAKSCPVNYFLYLKSLWRVFETLSLRYHDNIRRGWCLAWKSATCEASACSFEKRPRNLCRGFNPDSNRQRQQWEEWRRIVAMSVNFHSTPYWDEDHPNHYNLDLENCNVSTGSYSLMYILDMSPKAWSKASHAAGSMVCLAFMAACMTAWWALRAST